VPAGVNHSFALLVSIFSKCHPFSLQYRYYLKDLLLVLWAMSKGYGVASLRLIPFIVTLVSVVVLWRIVAVLWDSAVAMVRVLLLFFAVCEVLELAAWTAALV
jgi:hypothetical protein